MNTSRKLLSVAIMGLSLAMGTPAVMASSHTNLQQSAAEIHADISYTLKTNIGEKGMTFVGVGDGIDGQINPTLNVKPGAIVQITLIDGDGAEHNVNFPEFDALSDNVAGKGASTVIVFRADKKGDFKYFCTLPGHRAAGMEGTIRVGEAAASSAPALTDVSRDPADLPPPITRTKPAHLNVELKAEEVKGRLADNTSYNFWTFNGKVPGPMLRAREGDTVTLTLANDKASRMIHSVDLHAVTGPGGGAALLQVPPGDEKSITFKALKPGLYVYHCATPMVANHIANGMYGMILVEPAKGLPKVDEEFYVMQGEIYTTGNFGKTGYQSFDVQKLLDEKPEYFVFNGSVGALTKEHPLHAKVGEKVRIYFGVGGPNYTSSFHMIGEIFDHAYPWGGLTSKPEEGIQTLSVPPGGATVVDLTLEEPGKYIMVDHALSRMERGLAGFLEVEGKADPSIYRAGK